jgi:TusA-related sulfurtransferase
MKEIDARGLACPAPVLQTKTALQEDNSANVRVIIDNAAAQQGDQSLKIFDFPLRDRLI